MDRFTERTAGATLRLIRPTNMDQQALIERIVAEVMGKLRPVQANARPSVGSTTESQFRLSENIITADLLAENSVGKSVVEVSSRAIVTPSARDWLKQNRIELTRSTNAKTSTNQQKSDWLLVVQTAGEAVKAVLDDAGRSGAFGGHRETTVDAASAAKVAAAAVDRGGKCVVFSAEPEIVACLANRNEKVRAAVVADVTTVDRVKTGLDGNAFVVDPIGRSFFELRTLLRRIAK
ncbi:hypothetical protein GC176_17630 [bacterium]|nr:hypothetical protein [bacterium]